MIALSILVLSVKQRQQMLSRLLDRLTPQLTKEVEIIIGIDDCSTPVWQRRNNLLASAAGAYAVYVDDDDMVAENYCSSILTELEAGPDTVGFKVRRYTDGVLSGHAVHSMRYDCYANDLVAGQLVLQRTPNHLNPTRIDLMRQVGFRDNVMEDVDYAQRLKPLLHNEKFIDDYLYDYLYVRPQQRSVVR